MIVYAQFIFLVRVACFLVLRKPMMRAAWTSRPVHVACCNGTSRGGKATPVHAIRGVRRACDHLWLRHRRLSWHYNPFK